MDRIDIADVARPSSDRVIQGELDSLQLAWVFPCYSQRDFALARNRGVESTSRPKSTWRVLTITLQLLHRFALGGLHLGGSNYAHPAESCNGHLQILLTIKRDKRRRI